jgi:hypothetical protein
MRTYRTLTQLFEGSNTPLGVYLDQQQIEYTLAVDCMVNLYSKGWKSEWEDSDILVKCYTLLIDEHELSAITLAVDNVHQIKNRKIYNILNVVRGWFKWILK